MLSPSRLVAALAATLGVAHAGKPDQEPMPRQECVLPGQATVQVRLEHGSSHLPEAEVRAALVGALASWNAALPAGLRLVETPMNAPMPVGEVVLLVRFDADPTHFGAAGGVDELGDTRALLDRQGNRAITAVFVMDRAGSFSTTGAPTTRDLQLVLMHELGHALGMEHDLAASTMPPIMAPALAQNDRLVAASGKTLAQLRQVTAADQQAIEIAVLKRTWRDLSGTYTGKLKVTKLGKGAGGIAVGTELPVRPGDFVVKIEGGKVLVDYKGSKREAQVVELFRHDFKLELPDVADGRTLRTMTLTRGESNEDLDVTAVLESLRSRYEVHGVLHQKR